MSKGDKKIANNKIVDNKISKSNKPKKLLIQEEYLNYH